MLVVDLMHECELGTWKALFTHLLRLLYALPRGSEIIAALDSRYEMFVRSAAVCLLEVADVGFDKYRPSVTA
jgi:hypothetical protein